MRLTKQKLYMTKQVPYKLHENQKLVAQSKARFVVLNCGRRFGKSFFACEKMISKAIKTDSANIAYFATTQGHARDIMWKMLKNRVSPIAKKINEQRMEVVIENKYGTESTITLRGWENLDTARGQFFDLIVIDEAAFMRKFASGMREVLMPTLIDRKGGMLIISSPKGYNDFYDLYIYANSGNDKDWAAFTFTSYDNPTIDPAEIDRVRAKEDPDVFAQEYMAEFRKMQGLCVKAFDRRRHVHEYELPNWETKYAAIDWGPTNCPTLVVKVQNGHYYIDKLQYLRDEPNYVQKTIDYLNIEKPNSVYPDSAEKSSNYQLEQSGYHVVPVIKDVAGGIAMLNKLFVANRISISPNCEDFIWELENYVYRDGTETPVKENDHSIDAFRYLINTIETTADGSNKKAEQAKQNFALMYND